MQIMNNRNQISYTESLFTIPWIIKTMFGSSLPPVVCRRVGSCLVLIRYLCLFAYSVQHIYWCFRCAFPHLDTLCMVVSNTYCVVYYTCFCLRLLSGIPNITSFSGLSIRDCPFGFFNIYLTRYHVCRLL